MATKKSVFLSDRTAEWIKDATNKSEFDQSVKWSESINATFDQFRFLLQSSMPDLSMEEWTIILNVYAGSYFPAHGIPARIALDMMDHVGKIDIDNLASDYADLIRKVYAMSQLEQISILYFVQIFWGNKWTGEWCDIVSKIKSKF